MFWLSVSTMQILTPIVAPQYALFAKEMVFLNRFVIENMDSLIKRARISKIVEIGKSALTAEGMVTPLTLVTRNVGILLDINLPVKRLHTTQINNVGVTKENNSEVEKGISEADGVYVTSE